MWLCKGFFSSFLFFSTRKMISGYMIDSSPPNQGHLRWGETHSFLHRHTHTHVHAHLPHPPPAPTLISLSFWSGSLWPLWSAAYRQWLAAVWWDEDREAERGWRAAGNPPHPPIETRSCVIRHLHPAGGRRTWAEARLEWLSEIIHFNKYMADHRTHATADKTCRFL